MNELKETGEQSGVVSDGSRARRGRGRSLAALVLVTLASIAIVLVIVVGWSRGTLLDTDNFMRTMRPILKDPQVTRNIGRIVAQKTVEATDLQSRLSAVLPDRTRFLAAPVAAKLQELLAAGTTRFLNSEAGQRTWDAMLRLSHKHLIAILRGDSTYIKIHGEQLRLDLVPLVVAAVGHLRDLLPGVIETRLPPPRVDPNAPLDRQRQQLAAALGKPASTDFGSITLFESAQVRTAQRALRLFDTLYIVLIVLAVVLVIAALAVSPRRVRTLIHLGVGALVAAVVARFAVVQLSQALVGAAEHTQALPLVLVGVDTLFAGLLGILTWLLVGGVLLVVLAYLGPTTVSMRLLSSVSERLSSVGHAASVHSGPVFAWVGRHREPLRIGGLVVGALLLFVFARSLGAAVAIIVVCALYEASVTWLSASSAPEQDAEGRPDSKEESEAGGGTDV